MNEEYYLHKIIEKYPFFNKVSEEEYAELYGDSTDNTTEFTSITTPSGMVYYGIEILEGIKNFEIIKHLWHTYTYIIFINPYCTNDSFRFTLDKQNGNIIGKYYTSLNYKSGEDFYYLLLDYGIEFILIFAKDSAFDELVRRWTIRNIINYNE